MNSTTNSSTYEQLLSAVKDKSLPRVDAVLANNNLATLTCEEKREILHTACKTNSVFEVTQRLLDHGFDPRTQDSGQQTALHIAGETRDFAAAELLIQYVPGEEEEYISIRNEFGQTALHIACEQLAPVEFLNFLLQQIPDKENKRAYVNLRNTFGQTALHILSCQVGRKAHELSGPLAQCLLKADADKSAKWKGWPAGYYACYYSNLCLMELLVEPGSDLLSQPIYGGKKNYTCLHVAAVYGYADCVEWVLSNSDFKNLLDGSHYTAWERLISQKSFDIRVAKPFISREFQEGRLGVGCYWDISKHRGGWNVVCMGFLKDLAGLIGARLSLLDDNQISSDVVDWPDIELYKSPRTQNGFRFRYASCTFMKLPTNPERKRLKDSSMTDSISICMPYVEFRTARYLSMWRGPDENEAFYMKSVSEGRKYCGYGTLLHDVFFPPLTLDEYCCHSLSGDALNRRNCDQATLNPLGKASHITPGTQTLRGIPPNETLITVSQAWIWRIEDNVIISAGRDVKPGSLSDVGSNDLLRYIALVLGRFCWPSCPLPISELDDTEPELYLRYQRAIVDVSEEAETYLWDIGAKGIKSGTEKTCLHRIVDIGDELSMVRRVITEQQTVWKTFAKKAWPRYWNHNLGYIVIPESHSHLFNERESYEWQLILETDTSFEERITHVRQLEEEAQRVERTVMLMIELKSKHATIAESHASAIMSAAVVGFTVVTIIFTPMSYMATLFALPIKNLQKNQSKSIFGDSGAYSSGFVAWTTIAAALSTFAVTALFMWQSIRYLKKSTERSVSAESPHGFQKTKAASKGHKHSARLGGLAASAWGRRSQRKTKPGADLENGHA